jgi:hypothetical protein
MNLDKRKQRDDELAKRREEEMKVVELAIQKDKKTKEEEYKSKVGKIENLHNQYRKPKSKSLYDTAKIYWIR